jgi:protein-disulfide isomerase
VPVDAGKQVAALEQGTTEAGFPRLGSPDAPVVVEEFSSYACPHCRTFHEEEFPDLLDEIEAGTVQFVYIPVTHIGYGAKNAAQGAMCAAEQGKFWEMHDTLFSWQGKYVANTFHERRLEKGAANLGLDVAAFKACMDRDLPVLDRARDEFDRRDLSGTPSIFVNGEKVRDYDELDHLGEQ